MASATTSGGTPSSSTTARHPPPKTAVNRKPPAAIIGHCAICLRQLVAPDQRGPPLPWNWNKERMECYKNRVPVVPKAELDSTLLFRTFRQLDIRHQKWSASEDTSGLDGNPAPPPNELPIMCEYCGEKLTEVHRLAVELESKVKEFKKIFVDSKKGGLYAWREHQFEKDLKGGLEQIEMWSSGTTHGFEDIFGVEATPTTVTVENAKEAMKIEAPDFQEYDDNCEMGEAMDPSSPLDPSIESFEGTFGETSKRIRGQNFSVTNTSSTTSLPRKRGRKRKGEAPAPPEPKSMQKCDFCAKSLPVYYILEHVREHVGDYVYPCPLPDCRRAYTSPYKLETRHFKNSLKCWKVVNPACQCRKVNEDGKVVGICKCALEKICQTCGYKTTSYTELNDHLKSVHEVPSQKNFTCPVPGCEEAFTVRQSVYGHLDNDHLDVAEMNRPAGPLKIQKCMECKKKVAIRNMKEHIMKGHGAKEIIECKLCPFLFPSWKALVRHLAVHSTHPGGLFCFICNDDTKYHVYNTLAHHYLTAHNVGNLLTCHLCGKTYFNERGLKRHNILMHSGGAASSSNMGNRAVSSSSGGGEGSGTQEEQAKQDDKVSKKPTLVCDVEGCGKIFTGATNLRKHKVLKHLAVASEFKCDVEGCGRSFQLWRDLHQHKQMRHLGMQREKEMCEVCGEYVMYLWSHMKTHSQEKPHQCCYCGQRFRTTGGMKLHVKKHEEKGDSFKPRGPMKVIRKRPVQRQQ